MPVLSTTPAVDFVVPAAGAFKIDSTGPVRLLRRVAAGVYVPNGDVPESGVGAGGSVATNAVAGTTYQVILLHPSATFAVEQ